MKKFARILALTLVVLMLAMSLVACAAKPNKDPDKAKEALEDADYTVVLLDGILLEAAGEFANYDGLEAVLTAFNDDEKGVAVFYFEDDDAAKDAFETIKDEYDGSEAEEDKDWVAPTRSGAIIYCGHKDAIKAAK